MTRGLIAAGLALAWPGLAHADSPAAITLGTPRVQLLYGYSGRLSPNIAPPARFELWNVGAGEGSAEEPATDVLVTVPVRMPPSDMGRATLRPLTIAARDAKGRVLGRRVYPAGLIFLPVTGTAQGALFLSDVQCAGNVTFEAVYGAQRKSVALDFACGE